MALDPSVPRSRRAILGATLGALAATAAQALGRPTPVRAGVDGDVVLGASNASGSTTTLGNHSTTSVPLAVVSTYGVAMTVDSGTSTALQAHGVGIGVQGKSNAATAPGVVGWSTGNGTGLLGYSDNSYAAGTGTPPVGAARTGVCGIASQDATARGVWGASTLGTGVLASSTSGTALRVDGKASFKRAGRVSVAAGAAYVDVVVSGGLAGTPLVFANMMVMRSGTWVTAVRPNWPSSGKLRIYLNKAVTAATPVAWFVLG